MATLAPLGTTTAAAACTEAVRAAILDGQFEAGSRLPPERDLAAQLGVNRVTLRAALTRLQSEGLITTRQGSGHLVHDFRRRGGPQLLAVLSRHKVHFADLLAVRRALAALVLQRLFDDPPSPTALDALGREVDRFEKNPGAQADLDVMAKLLSLTGSVTLQLCINPVASVLLALPALQKAMFAEPQTNVAGYRALIDSLRHARRESKAERARLGKQAAELLEQLDAATLSRSS